MNMGYFYQGDARNKCLNAQGQAWWPTHLSDNQNHVDQSAFEILLPHINYILTILYEHY